jgi:dTDP-4-amino-4,6-dideoxygalactose transaminase
MVGYNFRLGELEAAMAIPQIENLDELVNSRIIAGNKFIERLAGLPGLQMPPQSSQNSNVFYILPFVFHQRGSVTRDLLVEALRAEGVPAIINKYANIHRLPIFLQEGKKLRDTSPWVFNKDFVDTYGPGKCDVAESLYDNTFFGLHMCSFEFDDIEIDQVVRAFEKVWFYMGIQ